MRTALLATLASSLILSGCAALQPKAHETAQDPALAALDQSAKSIQDAWNVIGGIDKAQNPGYMKAIDDFGTSYPPPLAKRTTIRWTGDIRPIVELLASQSQLPVRVIGAAPPTPVLVYVDVQEARIGDVLRDIGYQGGDRAGVRISTLPGQEGIELVYVKAH